MEWNIKIKRDPNDVELEFDKCFISNRWEKYGLFNNKWYQEDSVVCAKEITPYDMMYLE